MAKQHEEKRRFNRILYHSSAQLSTAGKTCDCQILDLSIKGCLLQLPKEWSRDQENHHKLSVNLSDDCEIEMGLKLTYLNGNQGGFYCNQIDLDSISQLRRLIELNLGDSRLLERDLDALAHSG